MFHGYEMADRVPNSHGNRNRQRGHYKGLVDPSLWRAILPILPLYATVLLLGYWWYVDYQPWNPLGGIPIQATLTPITAEVKAGETGYVRLDYTIQRDCRRDIELWLVNHRPHLLMQHHGATTGEGPGPRPHRILPVEVPAGTKPGPLVVKEVGRFHCNELRPYTYSTETVINVVP